jgi:plastocyanin
VIHSLDGSVSVGMKSIGLVLTVIALALAGCGGGGDDSTGTSSGSAPSSGSGGGGPKSVTIADYSYKPADITVPVGTSVRFTNEDSTPHTATSKESGAFDSGSVDTGQSASVTLDEAGTFAYYCVFHPFMKGTITVE